MPGIYLQLVENILFFASRRQAGNKQDSRRSFQEFVKALDTLSSADRIMLLSPQQRNIMDRAANRLLMACPFGTGKSFLLHEKCTKLLNEGEKAVFVLSYGGWDERRGGSEASKSFLLEKVKALFERFITDGEFSS